MENFKVLVNKRITFIEKMENIKSIETKYQRVFVTFIDDSKNDFHFDEIVID